MKYFLASFCFLTAFAGLEAIKLMGPVGNIIANSIFLCKEKPPGNEIDVGVDLKSVDDKGTKAMYANLTLNIPIDENIDYILDVQKWEGGGWKNYYNTKGKFCVDCQKLFGKLWQKLRAISKPEMPVPCPIKPGKYVIENYQVTSKDLTIPAIFYGRFMMKVQGFKNKKLIMCVQGEGNSQAP